MSVVSSPANVDRTDDPRQVGWPTHEGRAGRFGVVFAAVWLVFLFDSLRAAWRIAWGEGHEAAGWVGLVATVVFAATYLVFFSWIRARRRRLQMRVPAREAGAMLAVLVALMLVMVAAIGQEGTAAVVYVAVVGVMCLPTRAALAFTAVLAAAVEVSGHLVPGWSSPAGLTFAVCTAAFAIWGVNQLMARNLDPARRPGGERPARSRRRAQPLRPRPA